MRLARLKFAKVVLREVNEDNLFTWAAALAYSWLFAIFPFFIFLLSLLPLMPQQMKNEANKQINRAVDKLGHEAAGTLHGYLDPKLHQLLYNPPRGVLTFGLLIALWAASGGMAMTMAALDLAYEVQNKRPILHQPGDRDRDDAGRGNDDHPRHCAIADRHADHDKAYSQHGSPAGSHAGHATARLDQKPADVSATSPAATRAAAEQALVADPVVEPQKFTMFLVLWQISRYVLALGLLVCTASMIYHFGPRVKRKFHLLTPGVVFSVSIWIMLGQIFRIYVDRFGKYGETYGAVGGVIILLFFFYLDALVLLVGAEIDSEIEFALKKMTGGPEPTDLNSQKPQQKPRPVHWSLSPTRAKSIRSHGLTSIRQIAHSPPRLERKYIPSPFGSHTGLSSNEPLVVICVCCCGCETSITQMS